MWEKHVIRERQQVDTGELWKRSVAAFFQPKALVNLE